MNLLEESKLDLAKGRDPRLLPRQAARRARRHRRADGLAPRQGALRRRPHPHAARGQAADLLGRPEGLAQLRAALTLGLIATVARWFSSAFTLRKFQETMTYQQIAIEKFGSASDPPRSATSRRARPADDEVAIDVAYSGVNFADIQMRLGFYPDAPKKPFVPGYEVSGKVTAVGKNVTRRRGRRSGRRRHVLRRLRVARHDPGAPGVQAAAPRRSRGRRRPARQLLHRAARAVRDGARARAAIAC